MDFALYLVTDRRLCRGPLLEAVEESLRAGLLAVQLREKDLPGRDLLGLARPLRESTRRRGARLIINDRADIAMAVQADGVQRNHESLPVEALRAAGGPFFLIGASVHSRQEAAQAVAQGADFLVFGPVWDTPAKRAYGPPQGLEALAVVASDSSVPVLAIGGLTPLRAREALAAGAAGVAVISAILAVERPGDATKAFLDALGRP